MDHRSASFLVGLVLMQREAFGNLLYVHCPDIDILTFFFLLHDMLLLLAATFLRQSSRSAIT